MKHNGWFVNPHDTSKIAQIGKAIAIDRDSKLITIAFETVKVIWVFESVAKAATVYENMVRALQEV